jgi:hypothetical protein
VSKNSMCGWAGNADLNAPGTSCTRFGPTTSWRSRLPGGRSSGGSNRPTHRRRPGGSLPAFTRG